MPTSSPEITLNATKPAENASHFSLVTRRFSGAGLHDRNVHRADIHTTKNTDRKADSPLAYFTYRATPRVREKRYKGDPFQHRARSIFTPSVNPPTAGAATRTLPSLAIRSSLNRSDFASFFYILSSRASRDKAKRRTASQTIYLRISSPIRFFFCFLFSFPRLRTETYRVQQVPHVYLEHIAHAIRRRGDVALTSCTRDRFAGDVDLEIHSSEYN